MRHTPLTSALLGGALVLALGACGGDDSSATPSVDETPTAGSELLVKATDQLKFDKEAYRIGPGAVDVVYENTGSVAHTLLIDGVDGFKLSVGTEDDGTVDLEPGTYKLYCDVAGHEAAGMVAELTVD